MKYLNTAIIGLLALSACGASGPVTDNPAILGDWSCKSEQNIDGAFARRYSNVHFAEDGSFRSSTNVRVSASVSRMNVTSERTGKWTLLDGRMDREPGKFKITHLSASGPEFEGISNSKLKQMFRDEARKVQVTEEFVQELTSDRLVLRAQINSLTEIEECKRSTAK